MKTSQIILVLMLLVLVSGCSYDGSDSSKLLLNEKGRISGCYIDPYNPFKPYIKDYRLVKKLQASDGQSFDTFGCSVALAADGNTALIGAACNAEKGSYSGAAYVYRWSITTGVWEEKKLMASDGAASGKFGCSVALSADGKTALIGSHGDSSRTGAAYVYRWDSITNLWEEEKIVASDKASLDNFGGYVALSADGNTALIGAHGVGSGNGAAYVYRWSHAAGIWKEQKLLAYDGAPNDYFGTSLALAADGNTAIVGAYNDDDKGTDSGSVYIYRWNGSVGEWEVTKLVASDGTTRDYFGFSVSLSADGNTAVIGASNDDNGTYRGSFYIYRWNKFSGTWDEKKLITSDSARGTGYFVSLSAAGNMALISAVDDNAVYAYDWNYITSTWEEKKLVASAEVMKGLFGCSFALSPHGSTALIGASFAGGVLAYDSGCAYIFKRF